VQRYPVNQPAGRDAQPSPATPRVGTARKSAPLPTASESTAIEIRCYTNRLSRDNEPGPNALEPHDLLRSAGDNSKRRRRVAV
jgi:hypothetical protein